MENTHILMAGLTAIILFIFGLENFSREIQAITGERFRKSLGRATTIPVVGVIIGALGRCWAASPVCDRSGRSFEKAPGIAPAKMTTFCQRLFVTN